MSWEKLIKSKSSRGLGLRDPFMLNQVMGAKHWWRWIQGGQDLWKKIWERNYEMPQSVSGKLKIDLVPKGSAIWNLAAVNRFLIRQHSFWEIREGKTALFWEDSWQQREKFFSRLDLGEIFLFKNIPNQRYLCNYWNSDEEGQWRIWKGKEQWRNAPETTQWNNFEKEMKTRTLVATNGEDILRWGYRSKGMFTIEEGYYLKSNNQQDIAIPIWNKIQRMKFWPKVEYFLWLLSHKKT